MRNHPTCLPPSITCLSSLHSLDLSHNQVFDMPATFIITTITITIILLIIITITITIILITNQVVDLPACLLHLPDLHFLSLTGNRIHRLPNTLESLESSLQGLYLAQNCLAHLPPCLARCLLLKELYLDNNPVTHLPANLTSLPNLAILSITHTLVSSLPALPSPSCLRIQAEHCPNLLSVPYLTGN